MYGGQNEWDVKHDRTEQIAVVGNKGNGTYKNTLLAGKGGEETAYSCTDGL